MNKTCLHCTVSEIHSSPYIVGLSSGDIYSNYMVCPELDGKPVNPSDSCHVEEGEE